MEVSSSVTLKTSALGNPEFNVNIQTRKKAIIYVVGGGRALRVTSFRPRLQAFGVYIHNPYKSEKAYNSVL